MGPGSQSAGNSENTEARNSWRLCVWELFTLVWLGWVGDVATLRFTSIGTNQAVGRRGVYLQRGLFALVRLRWFVRSVPLFLLTRILWFLTLTIIDGGGQSMRFEGGCSVIFISLSCFENPFFRAPYSCFTPPSIGQKKLRVFRLNHTLSCVQKQVIFFVHTYTQPILFCS